MIVVDSSALIAILLDEPDAQDMIEALAQELGIVSAATVLETTLVATSALGRDATGLISELLDTLGLRTAAFDAEQLQWAQAGFLEYGKGRHSKARLNFGDCFAYALAKAKAAPLLFKGEDFAQTDVEAALA